jgi:PPOX class probable FMN-dependent enzyme
VVFRGFAPECDRLQIVTDDRSAKIEQIEANPQAEACWYFPKSRDQFRLRGHLIAVRPDTPDADLQNLRSQVWQNLSDNVRTGFAWPHPGGDRAPAEAFEVNAPNAETPLDSFTLLLLEPVAVDFLKLRGEPQNRWIYQRGDDGTWTEREVNP